MYVELWVWVCRELVFSCTSQEVTRLSGCRMRAGREDEGARALWSVLRGRNEGLDSGSQVSGAVVRPPSRHCPFTQAPLCPGRATEICML